MSKLQARPPAVSRKGLSKTPDTDQRRSQDQWIFYFVYGEVNDKEAIEVDTYPSSPHFGNVYVAWDINIVQDNNFAAQHLVVSRSTNGGVSYSSPAVLRTSGNNIGAIPRVAPDGTVYVMWGPLERKMPT